jgi:hypothetical protein
MSPARLAASGDSPALDEEIRVGSLNALRWGANRRALRRSGRRRNADGLDRCSLSDLRKDPAWRPYCSGIEVAGMERITFIDGAALMATS